jgi:hypothetical protein
MKNLNDIGISDVQAVMVKKGYEIFRQEGVPNIVGIRNAEIQSNSYNDKCWVWWYEGLNEIVHNYTISTHPGYYYLQKPIAGTKGTAILVPGQYVNCWVLAMHRGKQFALCQRAGQVRVYRDENRDIIQDFDPKTIDTGYFGIDLHSGSINDTDFVEKYSAGCQVWRYHEPHAELMQTFKRLSEKNGFNRFSYTLLNQQDF